MNLTYKHLKLRNGFLRPKKCAAFVRYHTTAEAGGTISDRASPHDMNNKQHVSFFFPFRELPSNSA